MDDHFEQMLAPTGAKSMANSRDNGAASSSSQQKGPRPDFIPSAAGWDGRKPGYVFKKDTKGLGYYRDLVFVVRDSVSSATSSTASIGGGAAGTGKRKREEEDEDDGDDSGRMQGGSHPRIPMNDKDAIEQMLEDAEAMGVSQLDPNRYAWSYYRHIGLFFCQGCLILHSDLSPSQRSVIVSDLIYFCSFSFTLQFEAVAD